MFSRLGEEKVAALATESSEKGGEKRQTYNTISQPERMFIYIQLTVKNTSVHCEILFDD